MKLISQDARIIRQSEGLQGIYDIICEAASTCYKSTPRSGQEAKTFIDKLIKNGHTAMLEFGTVYFKFPVKDIEDDDELMAWQYLWEGSPYVDYDCDGSFFYVTTNVRHLLDCNLWAENMFKYMVSPTKFHERRTAFRIITSISVARELTRHRVFSFAQESTRYVNYSKKNLGEIQFIEPFWYKDALDDTKNVYKMHLAASERTYNALINEGRAAQEAREVLPLGTKTEICMCGFDSDWKHFLDLRYFETTGKAHPDMKILAEMIKDKILNYD